ncbi:unnamed protein product, partial [Rotaria magnacalcarata]
MLAIHHGHEDQGRMKTFSDAFHEFSSNSVFHDLEEQSK